ADVPRAGRWIAARKRRETDLRPGDAGVCRGSRALRSSRAGAGGDRAKLVVRVSARHAADWLADVAQRKLARAAPLAGVHGAGRSGWPRPHYPAGSPRAG